MKIPKYQHPNLVNSLASRKLSVLLQCIAISGPDCYSPSKNVTLMWNENPEGEDGQSNVKLATH